MLIFKVSWGKKRFVLQLICYIQKQTYIWGTICTPSLTFLRAHFLRAQSPKAVTRYTMTLFSGFFDVYVLTYKILVNFINYSNYSRKFEMSVCSCLITEFSLKLYHLNSFLWNMEPPELHMPILYGLNIIFEYCKLYTHNTCLAIHI